MTLFMTLPAWSAAGPPMVSDDPATPGDSHWEINIATLTFRVTQASITQLPLVDINYGLGEYVQLKVEVPWVIQDAAGLQLKGFGDSLAGVKWRFYDKGEEGWRISTFPQAAFSPSARSIQKGIASSGVGYLAPIEFLHALGSGDINFELGRWFRPAGQGDSWIMGAVLTREVRKGFELMLELHDEVAIHCFPLLLCPMRLPWPRGTPRAIQESIATRCSQIFTVLLRRAVWCSSSRMMPSWVNWTSVLIIILLTKPLYSLRHMPQGIARLL